MAAAHGIRALRLPLGVDLESWPAVPPTPRPDGRPFRLIHVASLNAVKDPETLLATMARLRDRGARFILDVVGEDLTGGRVRAQAATLGLGDVVRFRGQLDQTAVRERMLDADLLVMTSRHEGGPMVLAEAALSGVPTVGTHVGQIAEWAPDGALTAPVGNGAALADSIAKLMDDDGLRMRIAAAAQRRALAEDADWSAARIDDLYREVTAG
jgi:glycosyltransferase involved in cell wall biosynthesis